MHITAIYVCKDTYYYVINGGFKAFFVLLQAKELEFMKNKRPLILISNDDGYAAKGINSLIEYVRGFGDVVVCAPESARSGYSCAFSSELPLRLSLKKAEEHLQVWACNGTPVDCLKMALSQLCDRKPDIVISGINHGDNASVNTHYSGTMGVVREGCMKGIPSVAFSLCNYAADADFNATARLIKIITGRVLEDGLPKDVCLNVNFPDVEEYAGVKVCRMCNGVWENELVKEHHPRGYDYYWMVGEFRDTEPEASDTDEWALAHGYVAITPTTIDITAYQAMNLIRGWEI